MTSIDPNLPLERLAGFELGTNLKIDNVFRDNDGVRLKLSYFDNDIGLHQSRFGKLEYVGQQYRLREILRIRAFWSILYRLVRH